jgi:hypothetical protein
MNHKAALLAALPLEFARFLADSKLEPDNLTPVERMTFQAGFFLGADWMVRYIEQERARRERV